MRAVALHHAMHEHEFGGKAVQLGAAARAGLRVPEGVALSHELVEAVALGRCTLPDATRALGGPLAVRSSGIGEDQAGSSFAGQHLSLLNVGGGDSIRDAVTSVHASAATPAARAYRERMGLAAEPKMGVVVQRLVDATCAGVMFTRDPIDGSDVRVVEAAWGLGEAVVQGLVTPDRVRFDRDGSVLERTVGFKDLAIVRRPDGGVEEISVDGARAEAPCLDRAMIAELAVLATQCEHVFGAGRDIEWAFDHGTLFVLQVRPITTHPPRR